MKSAPALRGLSPRTGKPIVLGKCVLGYRKRKRPSAPGRMHRRRSELTRLGLWRAEYDPTTAQDNRIWARVFADVLLFLETASSQELIFRCRRAGIQIDEQAATVALDYAAARCARGHGNAFPLSGRTAGELLGLRCEERIACAITTLEAVDETAEERVQRLADARRERDRLRKRKSREAKREAKKLPSLASEKPWEKYGVSRSTWYRCGKPIWPAEIVRRKASPAKTYILQGADEIVSTDAGPP